MPQLANKVVITCAVTGSIHTPTMSDTLPITPDQIATQAIDAAEERGIEEVRVPRAPWHGDRAGRPHRFEHRLGARRHIAARAGDHDADRVQQVPPRVIPNLFAERLVTERAREAHDPVGGAGNRMEPIQDFGVGHGCFHCAVHCDFAAQHSSMALRQ